MRRAQSHTNISQTIILDVALREKLLNQCQARGKTLSQLVREAITAYLKKANTQQNKREKENGPS